MKEPFWNFSKRLCVLSEKIGLDLEMEKLKFISGITEEEIRETLLRADLTIYTFWGLVKYATSLVETLKLSTKGQEKGKEIETKTKLQEFQVSSKYFKMAKKKGLPNGQCYNCMKGFHCALSCPQKFCKYCGGKTGMVKHFSLGCPQANVE